MKLGVNIDHIAVLKAARGVNDPDVLQAVWMASRAGADQITIHLREDRRHIDDYDAKRIVENSPLPVNLECAIDEKIIDIVCDLKPQRATLVPEKREEVTTEGGLDLIRNFEKIKATIGKLKKHEIEVSLFIEPDLETVQNSKNLGCDAVEFHTGKYANIWAMLNSNLAKTPYAIKDLDLSKKELKKLLGKELENITKATKKAIELGLFVAAGHGLNFHNVNSIVNIDGIEELNIGQSIVARSVFVGFENAVKEMVDLIR